MSIWYTEMKMFEFFAYLAWNAYSIPQNWGFGGLWTLNCDYSSSRPPKCTSLRKSASFKLSTVKICWAVWPVGELTESVMDTPADKQILSYRLQVANMEGSDIFVAQNAWFHTYRCALWGYRWWQIMFSGPNPPPKKNHFGGPFNAKPMKDTGPSQNSVCEF